MSGGKGGGGEGKVVCVTGASGYIASWLVKLLLLRGYTVKASVRNPNDPKKTEHLLALDGAKERLHLFQADLLEEGSFDPIVDGCEGVFHTASPVHFSVSDPQVELIDPALKGTGVVTGKPRCENDAPFQMGNVVVNEKAKGLGIEFTPLEVTLKDTVESLKEKNFVAL
ncbi:tetraketide alpha-pyrone reductase 1-like [Camellia sinensis]|uniref:tetraketide alpha-pyrone reductase 1-like n=1 Tax=Camellia sinensis TaxID=4442 RepID=UPI001035A48B|nr:tetraketide alpha-pyrone reductase 1-like [Camellia sinensis]